MSKTLTKHPSPDVIKEKIFLAKQARAIVQKNREGKPSSFRILAGKVPADA